MATIRRRLVILFVLFFFVNISCRHETETLLQRLQKLPEIQSVTEIPPPAGYAQAFEIVISQPVDHSTPRGRNFSQRIFLSHLGEDKPMVLSYSGYGVDQNSIYELATLLGANQVRVPHRYFLNARVEPIDWQYLTIWQAANDHHRIIDILKKIYKGRWVNSGASKGGMTALFDRRFFPKDVDATVAYVAPLMFGTEDPRFGKFLLEQAGSAGDRQRIKDFQRMLLANRQALLPFVENYAATNSYQLPIGAEAALEYAIVEYLFAFWQYGDNDTAKIPGSEAGPQAWYNHLTGVSSIYYYTDEGIAYFEPFFYQAYTELGYTPYFYEYLQDLLLVLKNPTYRAFAPKNVSMAFNPTAMQDINNWLQNEGDHIIYIYGGNDPYTATAVELTGKTDALKIIQPNANHGVKIAALDERERVIRTLEQWLGITINPAALESAVPIPAGEERFRLGMAEDAPVFPLTFSFTFWFLPPSSSPLR